MTAHLNSVCDDLSSINFLSVSFYISYSIQYNCQLQQCEESDCTLYTHTIYIISDRFNDKWPDRAFIMMSETNNEVVIMLISINAFVKASIVKNTLLSLLYFGSTQQKHVTSLNQINVVFCRAVSAYCRCTWSRIVLIVF